MYYYTVDGKKLRKEQKENYNTPYFSSRSISAGESESSTKKILPTIGIIVGGILVIALAIWAFRKLKNRKNKENFPESDTRPKKWGFRFY